VSNLILRMQLENKAITQYSNLSFNSSTHFNGKTLFANSSGIFSLEGENDNGSAIATLIEFFATNFGFPNIKRIRCLDIGMDTNGAQIVTVIGDESYVASKNLPISNYDRQATRRVFIDKVARGSYLAVQLENVSGCKFFISGIKAIVNVLSGRIN
jgi:hypothetical protein